MYNLTQRSKTIIMVTHDIEEAVFLSDRIVVMNNGPAATIREIEEVHLPRPRNKKEIILMDEYKVIRERLLSLLMDKVAIDETDVYKEKVEAANAAA
jgi:ABC-type nitrate/sulfonate/bicarbonate transport system ATPase subunit